MFTMELIILSLALVAGMVVASMAWLLKKNNIKRQAWPKHTGHSETRKDKFDQHGRRYCEMCKKYHNGVC